MLTILKVLTFLFGRLPFVVQDLLGRLLGFISYYIDSRHRGIALKNLELAYGDELSHADRVRIVKGLTRNLGVGLLEFFRIPWLKPEDFEGYVEAEGIENLEKALKKGKGVMFCTAHFGNWELMAAYCGLKVHPIDVVARKMDVKFIEDFFMWLRTRSGNRMVGKKHSMRTLMKTLQDNGILGVLVDQNVTRREGVFVDFFGTPASTNKGPALLAQYTGAAVIPAFIIREGWRHRIVVEEELTLVDTGDREADALDNMQRITARVEAMVRRYPEQWFWVHRRWRTRPE